MVIKPRRSWVSFGVGFPPLNATAIASMPGQTISTEAGDAWRDHLLNEVVAFLDQNRDAIIQRFEAEESGGLTGNSLEKHGLLDFDVAITLHRDRDGHFGLGSGFFKSESDSLKSDNDASNT